MKKGIVVFGIVAILFFLAVWIYYAIYLNAYLEKFQTTQNVKYDKKFSLVLGGGGNTGIYSFDSVVIVIDSKQDEAAEKLAERVKNLAKGKSILIVNTHFHPDHTSGNKLYDSAAILVGGNYSKAFWEKEVSKDILPTIWLKKDTCIVHGRDSLSIFGLGKKIHTASDVFVYDHKRKILFGGDVILNKYNPVFLSNANPNDYLWAFDELEKRCDIEIVVPGHGTIGGKYVIDSFRQYFLDMKAAAENAQNKDSLVAKYDEWASLPLFMSPEATIRSFKKNRK